MIPEHYARDIGERCETLIGSLRRYEALLPDYAISPDVWNRSIQLADRDRASGVSVPSGFPHLCVREDTRLDVAHDDAHFDELAKLED